MCVFDVRASSSYPRLPLCQFCFYCALRCWASPRRKIAYSISHSLTLLIWFPGNGSFRFGIKQYIKFNSEINKLNQTKQTKVRKTSIKTDSYTCWNFWHVSSVIVGKHTCISPWECSVFKQHTHNEKITSALMHCFHPTRGLASDYHLQGGKFSGVWSNSCTDAFSDIMKFSVSQSQVTHNSPLVKCSRDKLQVASFTVNQTRNSLATTNNTDVDISSCEVWLPDTW